MQKRGIIFLIILASLLMPFASAEINESESDAISKAYTCLENAVNNRTTTTLSLQESLFSILALGRNTKAESKIENEKRDVSSNQTCWPKGSCTLKETAQALLAYEMLGKNTDKIEQYLLSKSAPTTGLDWFLMVDVPSQQSSNCRVRYSGSTAEFSIGEDMRLSGSAGSCLSVAENGYWFAISSSCLDRSYEISCDQDFVTTLVYRKSNSDTLFISPNTRSAAALGYTNETIQSRCLRLSGECDYEGTLWAALALDEADRNVASLIPYLVATAPDKESLFPSAILYKLTQGQEHFSTIIQQQRSNQYWQATGTTYNRFYDTSLALLALQGRGSTEEQKAKDYLLRIQDSSSCWNNNNIRDTAFLLYSGWPEESRGTSGGGGGGSSLGERCEAVNPSYSCVSSVFTCTDAGGNILNHDCTGSLKCCSLTVPLQTCSQQNGNLCASNEVCSSSTVDSVEGNCCLGTCTVEITDDNQCLDAGGICASSCDVDSEDQTSDQCSQPGNVCCVPIRSTSSGSSWGLWITLFIILIILVALAIVFRKKLQMWWFQFRKGKSTSSTPVTIRRPPFPPTSPFGTTPQRYPAQPRRATTQVDREMEETMRKLRDISK